MKTALLIIDVQNVLCTGEYAAFDIDSVIEKINAVSANVRAADAPVILIQHEEDGGPLQFDSSGWHLADALATHPTDIHVRKTACDSFHKTALQEILRARKISDLIICGLQSEFCVDATVRRALALGYPVALVADGHSTIDNGVLSAAQITAHHNATLANMTSFGARVTLVSASDVSVA